MKKLLAISLLLATLFVMSACQSGQPKGLHYNVEGLPSIKDFSGTDLKEIQYDDACYPFVCGFPQIESAKRIQNGIEEDIDPKDPRLIRLLNFFAYSNENILDAWTKGWIDEEHVPDIMSTGIPILEVIFDVQDQSNPGLLKIVICGDSYLQYWHSERNESGVGTVHPYSFLVEEDKLFFNDFPQHLNCCGKKCWIDLLEYAGF